MHWVGKGLEPQVMSHDVSTTQVARVTASHTYAICPTLCPSAGVAQCPGRVAAKILKGSLASVKHLAVSSYRVRRLGHQWLGPGTHTAASRRSASALCLLQASCQLTVSQRHLSCLLESLASTIALEIKPFTSKERLSLGAAIVMAQRALRPWARGYRQPMGEGYRCTHAYLGSL